MSSTPRLVRHGQHNHNEGPTDKVVLGVDTHKDVHVAAVINALGALRGSATFPTTAAGYRDLVAWVRTFGTLRWAGVECTGSYGAALTRHLRAEGVEAIEVNQPDRHCCVRRWRVRAGCADASSPLSVASAAVQFRRVPVPVGDDHSGCELVLALWDFVPRRRGVAGRAGRRGGSLHDLQVGAALGARAGKTNPRWYRRVSEWRAQSWRVDEIYIRVGGKCATSTGRSLPRRHPGLLPVHQAKHPSGEVVPGQDAALVERTPCGRLG